MQDPEQNRISVLRTLVSVVCACSDTSGWVLRTSEDSECRTGVTSKPCHLPRFRVYFPNSSSREGVSGLVMEIRIGERIAGSSPKEQPRPRIAGLADLSPSQYASCLSSSIHIPGPGRLLAVDPGPHTKQPVGWYRGKYNTVIPVACWNAKKGGREYRC